MRRASKIRLVLLGGGIALTLGGCGESESCRRARAEGRLDQTQGCATRSSSSGGGGHWFWSGWSSRGGGGTATAAGSARGGFGASAASVGGGG